ncbi:hypothetical protein BABINDRAFT_161927 [Babjeviella inositovora NRRL Y-12698]|uniref:Mediator of RNA polymerase II transcription subunit 17 n=1 Tax=Babjeviella inositovora NRRL Y-12698 TaxID=984486 RepID=A0A1E3QRG5_9ASCO|nr:uncharacterized protein BABINDRAFT_161927 [Babjeviella inositovora NRRL Y-12698]ODQ79537.1 hypothetical protein BABINDRAFT_161927 [Babjeviella inositovora NRRL Y-12698]
MSRVVLNLDPQLVVGNQKDPFIQNENTLPLNQIIPRIIAERGSFLNLTEESLSEEINSEREVLTKQAIHVASDEYDDADDDEAKTRGEEFLKSRNEIIGLVQSALNESSLSLDFVSLMISAVKPNLGNLTMSPHLKQHVPAGSLTSHRVYTVPYAGEPLQPKKLIHTEEGSQESDLVVPTRDMKIGHGWKLESLERTAGLLRETSIRLSEEILREKQYWSNINHVLANSHNSLFKVREGRVREIGVKYGYHESGSRYHLDKGVAILKRLPDGELAFTPVSSHANTVSEEEVHRYVRVRVVTKVDDEWCVTGESMCGFRTATSEAHGSSNETGSPGAKVEDNGSSGENVDTNGSFDMDIEGNGITESNLDATRQGNEPPVDGITTKIQRAQFFLFEEELFYQLTREASSLLPYQVTLSSEKIVLENGTDELIEIDAAHPQERRNFSHANDNRADCMASFLRLMLCHQHRRALQANQRMPSPSSGTQRLEPLLLRPLVGHIRHHAHLAKMQGMLEALFDDGEPVQVTKYFNLKRQDYAADPLVRAITPPMSKFMKVVVDGAERLEIKVVMSATASFCNSYISVAIVRVGEAGRVKLLDVNFTDVREVADCLGWALHSFRSG